MSTLTRKAIMRSCISLLEERPLSRISVKDIVEDCGINRNTFYYHFSDLPNLIEEIVREDADRILREYAQVGSLEECLRAATDFAMKHRRAALHIYNSANRDIYEQYLMEICGHVMKKFVEMVSKDIPASEEVKNLIAEAYKCECFGYVTHWMNQGLDEKSFNNFLRFCELRSGSTEAMLRKSIENNAAASV